MAQVPLRMAQPGLVPPHQQRPPMMVSMTQPPPVSMQGLVSMAPMMGPGGGMALMTQAMNHPDSGHEHHTMNGPFHHHHHHHHHHAHHPPHGAAPRPHGSSQGPHPVPPPPHPSGPPQPPHSAPHSQYHPHPGAPHHVPHSHHNGQHSVHHSSAHSASHSHSGPHPPPHMTSHSSSNNSNTHSTHGHPQSHLQSGPPHMNQPGHSIPNHSPHQMSGMNTGSMSSNQHHTQQQHHHSQHPHHHQPIHQQMQLSQLPQQPPPQPPQQHQHQILGQPPQHQAPQSAESATPAGGMIVLSNTTGSSCTTMSMVNALNATPSSGASSNSVVNGIANRGSSTGNLNGVEATLTSSPCTSSLVSTREKTPMCLINELARYNKISHQYCLTDEKGPAHKKIFTVTLKLGDSEEEYAASGPSIKKAQHSAAALSLEKTKFKHPPPKTPKQNKQTKLTPTVELNALAMKRGEAAVYTFIETPRPPNPYAYNVPPNLRGVYSQKFYGRPPVYPMFFVSLRVGNRDFGGEGATAQQAKHNAASKALKVIKALPMPETSSSGVQSTLVSGGTTAPAANPVSAVGGGGGGAAGGADFSQLDPNADLKSPISLVHEIALKRSLTVAFEVVRESGPPHMRTFVTTCTVGEIRTQGEGTGKKISKKRAAELMLEELKKLPPLSTAALTRIKRKPSAKKKSRNLIKVGREEQKAAPEYGQGINPISRLIQIQQAKKEKEPVYTLLAERGVPRRREFVMQVAVGANTAQGSGPNKKLAKRAAAESMLQLLGYSRPQPQPTKPAIKMDGSHSDTDKTRKQVTFLEETDASRGSVNGSLQLSAIHLPPIAPGSGRQLVPGLIMMPDGSALHGYPQSQPSGMNAVANRNHMNMQATAAIAKELLESGSSPTAKALSEGQANGTQAASKLHLGNHQIRTGVQSPVAHQQSAVVPSPQQPMHPHMNHQPMLPVVPSSQIQSSPQSSQAQQNSSHSQIQSPTTTMAVPTNNSNNTNANNSNITSSSNTNNNNMNNTTTTTTRNGGLTISGNTSGQAVRPKDQLMYLANILNLQVQFTDFPRGSKNNSEFLSLVSLSTSPPHVSHGAGPNTEASHDQACLTALQALAEMGLDTVTSGNASKAT